MAVDIDKDAGQATGEGLGGSVEKTERNNSDIEADDRGSRGNEKNATNSAPTEYSGAIDPSEAKKEETAKTESPGWNAEQWVAANAPVAPATRQASSMVPDAEAYAKANAPNPLATPTYKATAGTGTGYADVAGGMFSNLGFSAQGQGADYDAATKAALAGGPAGAAEAQRQYAQQAGEAEAIRGTNTATAEALKAGRSGGMMRGAAGLAAANQVGSTYEKLRSDAVKAASDLYAGQQANTSKAASEMAAREATAASGQAGLYGTAAQARTAAESTEAQAKAQADATAAALYGTSTAARTAAQSTEAQAAAQAAATKAAEEASIYGTSAGTLQAASATAQDNAARLEAARIAAETAKSGQQTDIWGSLIGAGAGALALFSDENLKEDVGKQRYGPSLARLRSVSFRYKGSRRPENGVMAQDLEKGAMRSSVINTPMGKMVDTRRLTTANTSALAEHERRLQEIGKLVKGLSEAKK